MDTIQKPLFHKFATLSPVQPTDLWNLLNWFDYHPLRNIHLQEEFNLSLDRLARITTANMTRAFKLKQVVSDIKGGAV